MPSAWGRVVRKLKKQRNLVRKKHYFFDELEIIINKDREASSNTESIFHAPWNSAKMSCMFIPLGGILISILD